MDRDKIWSLPARISLFRNRQRNRQFPCNLECCKSHTLGTQEFRGIAPDLVTVNGSFLEVFDMNKFWKMSRI